MQNSEFLRIRARRPDKARLPISPECRILHRTPEGGEISCCVLLGLVGGWGSPWGEGWGQREDGPAAQARGPPLSRCDISPRLRGEKNFCSRCSGWREVGVLPGGRAGGRGRAGLRRMRAAPLCRAATSPPRGGRNFCSRCSGWREVGVLPGGRAGDRGRTGLLRRRAAPLCRAATSPPRGGRNFCSRCSGWREVGVLPGGRAGGRGRAGLRRMRAAPLCRAATSPPACGGRKFCSRCLGWGGVGLGVG